MLSCVLDTRGDDVEEILQIRPAPTVHSRPPDVFVSERQRRALGRLLRRLVSIARRKSDRSDHGERLRVSCSPPPPRPLPPGAPFSSPSATPRPRRPPRPLSARPASTATVVRSPGPLPAAACTSRPPPTMACPAPSTATSPRAPTSAPPTDTVASTGCRPTGPLRCPSP
uniref:Uncharacterized protein n=1 Tax=Steinernema glaseri TaxID=37863 RepID=A0A1I7YGD5_9BILA